MLFLWWLVQTDPTRGTAVDSARHWPAGGGSLMM